MQEPKVVGPDAAKLPSVIANAGGAVALVNVIVVGVVVPKSVTPAGKINDSPTTAAAVLAFTGTVRLLLAIVFTGNESPPPPQAAKAAETSTVKNNLLALIINGLYWRLPRVIGNHYKST